MIKIRFKGPVARNAKSATTVVKSVNVESVLFDFDDSWNGLVIWACFRRDSNQEYHVMMPDSREVIIPWEIFEDSGKLYIGAVGFKDGEIVKPTVWVYVADVVKGVDPQGSISVIPTPTAFEQAMAALTQATEALDGAVEEAEAAKTSAAASAVLAESWTIGETGTREGENQNNAKFWAQLAQQGAEESGYVWLDINEEDGELYVMITPNLDSDLKLEINEDTGELEVIVYD